MNDPKSEMVYITPNGLKKCPFCGGAAEIFTGRNHPANSNYFKTEAEAEEYINTARKKFVLVEEKIYYSHRRKKYHAVYIKKGYIPRCLKTQCVGRSSKIFDLEWDAIQAWNRRAQA